MIALAAYGWGGLAILVGSFLVPWLIFKLFAGK